MNVMAAVRWLSCFVLLLVGLGALPIHPCPLLPSPGIAEARRSGAVSVRGYYRKDGTYVRPHMRSAPDGNFNNNWSTKGNVNPYTGEPGTNVSPPASYGQDVSVEGYYRKDGTYVQPHMRSAPDGDPSNNWSTKGNVNPYTGEEGTRTAVEWMQGALRQVGEDPGPVDGLLGPRTTAALIAFARRQETMDLPLEATLRKLSAYVEDLKREQASPPTPPVPSWLFGVGSTAPEVLHAQGPPDSVRDEVWWYGRSTVTFQGARVVRWETSDRRLNATVR